MSDAAQATELLSKRLDKALATVVATKSPEDRYFIGEAILAGVVVFVLNRYAGAYVDRLGLKPLAEGHADATLAFLEKVRSKSATAADQEKQEAELQAALTAIKSHGVSSEAEQAAEKTWSRS